MKLKTLITTTLITAVMAVNALAADITVVFDGEQVTFEDAQPKIINDRTMVPIRGLFEKMGYTVSWDNRNKVATLRSRRLIISASESFLNATVTTSNNAFVDISGDVMPVISDGRMYLPLRAISRATGCAVDWDSNTKTVNVSSEIDSSAGDEDDYILEAEGNMSATMEEYLTKVFAALSDIRTFTTEQKDPVFMKLYGIGKVNSVAPTKANYEEVLLAAETLKDLEAPKSGEDISRDVSSFASIVENACKLAMSDGDDITSQMEELQSQRESISLQFSQDLVTYFNENNVSFEQVFSEYCLDAMN